MIAYLCVISGGITIDVVAHDIYDGATPGDTPMDDLVRMEEDAILEYMRSGEYDFDDDVLVILEVNTSSAENERELVTFRHFSGGEMDDLRARARKEMEDDDGPSDVPVS